MVKHVNVKRSIFIMFSVFVMSCFALISYASQTDLEREKAAYMEAFSTGTLDEMKQQAMSLEWKGLTDTAIFDLIEVAVLKNMNTSDKKDLDSTAWLVKSLAFSGNSKYLPTISKVAAEGNDKLKRHASNAAGELPLYASRNAIISNNLAEAADGRLNQQRVLNLLRSGDSILVRAGVREVHDHYASGPDMDKLLLDEIKSLLLSNLNANSGDSVMEDALAWMCKTMGATGDQQYKAVLSEVTAKSSSPKIRKYAEKSM